MRDQNALNEITMLEWLLYTSLCDKFSFVMGEVAIENAPLCSIVINKIRALTADV